jgi:hypothetical protein
MFVSCMFIGVNKTCDVYRYLPSWSTVWLSILFGFSLLYSEAWSLITTWFRMWENKARRKAVAAVVWPEPKISYYSIILFVCFFDGVERHFQQYFSYIVEVSFIDEWKRRTRRKPLTCRKSLTSFITQCCTPRPGRDSNSHQWW